MGGVGPEGAATACAGRQPAERGARCPGPCRRRDGARRAIRFSVTLVITTGILGLGPLGVTPSNAAVDPLRALELQSPNARIEAPDFRLPDLSGKKVRIRDFRGKVVFLNFFATWCGPCREEMPDLERLSESYRSKGLVVLAINVGQDARTVRSFMRDLRLSFPAVLDEDGAASYLYGIRPIPVSFLVDRDGAILWRAMGAREWDSAEVRQYLDRMLARPRQK